jgi:hypothetical protein
MVLQEALARNEVKDSRNTGFRINKNQALAKTKAFIQNIHHFRDDSLQTKKPPIERVAIFDEAQRAWTLEQTNSLMSRKKGIQGFKMSARLSNKYHGQAPRLCNHYMPYWWRPGNQYWRSWFTRMVFDNQKEISPLVCICFWHVNRC